MKLHNPWGVAPRLVKEMRLASETWRCPKHFLLAPGYVRVAAPVCWVCTPLGYSLMSYIPGCKIVFEGVIFLVVFYAQEKVENTMVVVCLT